MVIKGRSRSNGSQLANYLINGKENDLASVLDIRGTAQPESLRRSLLEMSLTSDLTQRGKLGLYHAQVNPAIGEDRPMTREDWLKAADILEKELGFEGQKRVIVLHEKKDRVHGHVVWERYDHETGKLRGDGKNYEKHDRARAEIERELGHEQTQQRKLDNPDHKRELSDLWAKKSDIKNFITEAEKQGYTICQGNDRRPFRVITPDGQSLDLVRQLEGIKTREVRDLLQPIRNELKTEEEALSDIKDLKNSRLNKLKSDNLHEMSDSQDLALMMLKAYREQSQKREEKAEIKSDNGREISDSQDLAENMLERYRRAKGIKEQENSITDNAADMLERYRQSQRDQGNDNSLSY